MTASNTNDVQPEIEEQDENEETTETSTSAVVERAEKNRVSDEIGEWVDDARDLAEQIGLDPYHVNYWVVDNEEMNELVTYDGFQQRYPHWRWGMKYDRRRKEDEYFGGKIFEIVNNDDPAHAFLQLSNSEGDQKAVVTHVEAHADFFKNNQWFRDSPNAAQMLSRHADQIEDIMSDPDVSRDDVESLIDTVLCIEDNIDQRQTMLAADPLEIENRRDEVTDSEVSMQDRVEDLAIDESIRDQVFDDAWIEQQDDDSDREFYPDLLGYIMRYGHRFDESEQEAREFEDWEQEIIRMLREESYYFAPQKMTKILNEGWASYHETVMMAWENFAGDDEFVEYADHHSKVLEAPGLNPYELGRELWMHVENKENRREVADKLLRIDDVTPRNFHDRVDFDRVREGLDHPESYSPAKRNYSLARPENRGYVEQIDRDELNEIYRYIVDDDRYDAIEEALLDVDYERGWERMREVRETHVDVTFIDEFLDKEFVEDRDYFVWDYDANEGWKRVSSTDPEDVKKKLLMEFSNFGKPTIVVEDGNYNNSGELLLTHKFNGIPLDVHQAGDVLERLADVWGRQVHLRTIAMPAERDHDRIGFELRYDPEEHDEPRVNEIEDEQDYEYLLPDSEVDDYYTRPEEWE